MRAKSENDVFGIDVSQHQGVIDWSKIASSTVKFVYIKATEGRTYTDPKFVANAEDAEAAGVLVGFYHYAHPENNTPEDEATHFFKTVYGHSYRLPLVLDVEGEASKLGKEKLTDWCGRFLAAVTKLAKSDVMVYTGASFAKTYLGPELGKYPLWIAHYGVNVPMSNSTWNNWSAFQYSSSGKVNGIAGYVDVNAMDLNLFSKYGTTREDECTMSKEDAEKIIRFLSAGYAVAADKASRDEFKRLADEVRKAASIPTT